MLLGPSGSSSVGGGEISSPASDSSKSSSSSGPEPLGDSVGGGPNSLSSSKSDCGGDSEVSKNITFSRLISRKYKTTPSGPFPESFLEVPTVLKKQTDFFVK